MPESAVPAPAPPGGAATAADLAGRPVQAAREALSVRRVFGEPYRADGVTVIPVARVRGGSGMGFGSGTAPGAGSGADDRPGRDREASSGPQDGSGAGGGFGITARPAGVYVVADGRVRWEPALDLGRVILGGQVLGGLAILAWAWAWSRRRA